jgi:putative membrane protein
MHELRKERAALAAQNLIHAESSFPTSMTLVTAVILLGIGIAAGVSTIFNIPL